MCKNKKKTQNNREQEELLAIGRYYTKNNHPSRVIHYSCVNCCVYVPDAFRMTGILWWLHSIGYVIQLNMMNLYEPARLNKMLIITHGYAALSGTSGLDDVREWCSRIKDDEYYKGMICCNDCVEAFKVLAEWEPDDDSTHLYLDKPHGKEVVEYGNYYYRTDDAVELTPEEIAKYIKEHPTCINI